MNAISHDVSKPAVAPGSEGSRLAALNAWVAEVAALTKPDAIHWCDGSDAENAALIAQMQRDGTLVKLNRTDPPEQLPAPLAPGRRRPRRAPDLRLHQRSRTTPARTTTGCRRPTATRKMDALFDGCMKRPHDVRDPVLHGPDRLAAVALRRGDHRLAVRGRQHAHHDAHGRAGPGAHRARGLVREGPALDRRARPRAPLHHAFPRRADDQVVRLRLRRQRAARARSATRCASPRTRPRRKAGWPSTC